MLGLHCATRELRDHWVNKFCKGTRGNNSFRKVYANSMEDKLKELGDRIAMEGDAKDGQLPRAMVLVKDGEDYIGHTR